MFINSTMCAKFCNKFSVIRRISNKAVSFILVVWARPLLNTTNSLWVSAYFFIADDMAQKVD